MTQRQFCVWLCWTAIALIYTAYGLVVASVAASGDLYPAVDLATALACAGIAAIALLIARCSR